MAATTGSATKVQIEYLRPNPFQPRMEVNPHKLKSLVDSIKRYGFIGNIEARHSDPLNPASPLEIVFGHRRVMAAQQAGLTAVPVSIVERSDEEMQGIAYIENATHEKLTYWEEAQYFHRLNTEYGMPMRRIAELLGVGKGYVENRLNILKLNNPALLAAAQQNEITMSSALALVNLSKVMSAEALEDLLDRVRSGDLHSDDLLVLEKARKADIIPDNQLTDDGKRIIDILKQPKVPVISERVVNELRQIAAGLDQSTLDEDDLPPGPGHEYVGREVIFDERDERRGIAVQVERESGREIVPNSYSLNSSAFRVKTPREKTLKALESLTAFSGYFTTYASEADWSLLSEDESAQMNLMLDQILTAAGR